MADLQELAPKQEIPLLTQLAEKEVIYPLALIALSDKNILTKMSYHSPPEGIKNRLHKKIGILFLIV